MAYIISEGLNGRSIKKLCDFTIKYVLRNPLTNLGSNREISTLASRHIKSLKPVKHMAEVSLCHRHSDRMFSMLNIPVDPYKLIENDLKSFYFDINEELRHQTKNSNLLSIATYYFDGQGKAMRPMIIALMAKAINFHVKKHTDLQTNQRQLALVAEMIHSASLIHDDIVDHADFRRGKPSVNVIWNHKQVTMAGNFILTVAFIMVARLKNDDVTIILSKMVSDLIHGELMQLGSRETENERFAHYLNKTYCKTASLIANSLKAAALLAGANEQLLEVAFQYGRNVGIAFQLIDDLLDYVSTSAIMGKPTATDLKLGLATAPVLFACESFPELNGMIIRRFQEAGDVEKAFEMVHKSKGLEQTQLLAKKHCMEAVRLASCIQESPYQKGLTLVPDMVLNRIK